jgi:hypothetical protein
MFDETIYKSHETQLNLILRYIYNGVISEDFLQSINLGK